MSERDIFLAVLDLPDPAARTAYLDGACGGDAARRARVEALLHAHESAGSFLIDPAVAAPEGAPAKTEAFESTPSGAEDDEALSFLAPPQRPESLGRIRHYEVLEVLGRGGFGIVFRAFDDVLQRVVAVKVLAPQMAVTSPARKRFLREARSSAQVRHENVVQVHAVEEQPLPYLVMEFIPGETLQQRLDRTGPLDVAEILRIGRQIAEGLAAAHAQGLIHRDIKPANVLIEGGARQRVKLTDFGLARAADDASISQSGIVAGTPMFMAPDQAKGAALDHRADLFSLGSVLYVMCSGHPPFRASGTLAVLKRVCEEGPRPIREVIPEVPEWLCRIVGQLHAKDPAERFQSAREVGDLLADCETQWKSHGALKDLSRVPGGKKVRKLPTMGSRRGMELAAIAVVGAAGVFVVVRNVTKPADMRELRGIQETIQLGKASEVPPLAVAPFDASTANEYQGNWAKHLDVPVKLTNSIGMTLRLIPPGEFTMGTDREQIAKLKKDIREAMGDPGWEEGVDSEGPTHRVRLTRPYYLGTHEVTVAQFRQFVHATGYKTECERNGKGGMVPTGAGDDRPDPKASWRNPFNFAATDDQPVLQISWNDAQEFCRWLSQKEGCGYRLPTEAEWEFACRAGSAGRFSFGDDPFEQARIAVINQQGPAAVGSKKPNQFGLFDMEGNAWEWCADWYADYSATAASDPQGPATGTNRVLRGGDFLHEWWVARPGVRVELPPNESHFGNGFRVAISAFGPRPATTSDAKGRR